MQQQRARKKKTPAPVAGKIGRLKITHVLPFKLNIGGGERTVRIFASGLFEFDEFEQEVPKQDLVAKILRNNGEIDDTILVEMLGTDAITDKYIEIKITVPVHESISEGYRAIVLKQKNESLNAGKCADPNSQTCDDLGPRAVQLVDP